MSLILIVFLVLLIFVGLMAIGVMFGRKPIAGSCGGVGAALGEKNYTCPLCGGDEYKCIEQNTSLSTSGTDESKLGNG